MLVNWVAEKKRTQRSKSRVKMKQTPKWYAAKAMG
jgi:hypothetical protein